ncbi:MAG: restriction endonuclease subunit S [Pseudomonadota bacterium]
MNKQIAENLELHFDTAFAAPDGIKKLRELILTLAMQGKLVPQDPSDQPASELLKEIEAEKKRLVKEGKIKEPKSLRDIKPEEILYELPQGWKWVRLGTIATKLTDGSHNPPKDAGSGFPMLSSQNVNFGNIDFSNPTRYVSKSDFLIENRRTKITSGDVLLTIVASLGRPAVVPENAPDFVLQRSVAVIGSPIDSGFLCKQLGSPHCVNYYSTHAKGTAQRGIYLGKLGEMLIPLPPLPEQHRIVAKIDQLMVRCDELEKLRAEREQRRRSVHIAALKQLLDAQERNTFDEAWHFITQHFGELYTVKENVTELRKAILRLAVMGKLVPQDPNDPAASELLKEIDAEKKRLVKEGKIKVPKPLPAVSAEEIRYGLPNGWVWSRLQNVLDVRDGTHDSPKDADGTDTYPLITSKNFVNGKIDFTNARKISAEDHLEIVKRSCVDKLDILFSMIGGNIGNQVIVEEDREFSIKNVALFKYYNKNFTYPYFIKRFMEHLAIDLQQKAAGGAQPFISLGFLRNLVIALPPKTEQHRIVAKIDQLMKLCDKLEQGIEIVTAKQTELLNAVTNRKVNRLTEVSMELV